MLVLDLFCLFGWIYSFGSERADIGCLVVFPYSTDKDEAVMCIDPTLNINFVLERTGGGEAEGIYFLQGAQCGLLLYVVRWFYL